MKIHAVIFLLFLGHQVALAQPPLLERKISVELRGESVEESLKKIAVAGAFVFSYNPAILERNKSLHHRFVNKSIRQILDEIFKGSVQYKVHGNYIILTAGEQASLKKEPTVVKGYVIDRATGESLKDVSVYDPVSLTSALTDSYGYFEIKIERPPSDVTLSVNRLNYADTIVVVHEEGRLLNIPISIDKEKIVLLADSVSEKVKRFWHRQAVFFSNMNLLNVDDTIYRRAQFSLVPFVGTNHKMSGNVINDYSLNILGGYSLGVRKGEFGGLANLVRGDVEGVQVAGLFNGVGGDVRGVQLAGLMNGNGQSSEGAQFTGGLNINLGQTRAVTVGGIGNIAVGSSEAHQIAGVFNIAAQDKEVLQLAGVYNIAAGSMEGVQLGGVFNIVGKQIHGVQVAGVFNVASGTLEGAQISGVANFASKVKGTQIGLINIADSIDGVPIGFMSIVWKGYHKIEVSADEVFYHNISFRTGVRQFYNIFTAGAKPSTYNDDKTTWSFGYGVGTAPRLSRKLFLNFDLTANQIVEGNSVDRLNLLNKLYVGFDYQAFKKLSFTMGATLNGYLTEDFSGDYPSLFTDYQPSVFYVRDFRDHDLKMWLGAKIGVRFL